MTSPQRVPSFPDEWFRQFDKATDGFRDETGFVHRFPVRFTSDDMVIHGTCDPEKVWNDFKMETKWTPVLVGGKAVLNLGLNDFLESDSGGSFRETSIMMLVTAKNEPLSLPYESPLSLVVDDPKVRVYCMRAICADVPGNPGAAMKVVAGGRGIYGFAKHPQLGTVDFSYEEKDGKKVGWNFECHHVGKLAVKAKIALPETDPNVVSIPMDVTTPPDVVISSPTFGGTHLGHNGAHQVQFGSAVCGTQNIAFWNKDTDSLIIGDAAHYAPFGRWGFEPLLKAHSPGSKAVGFKPANWLSGADTEAAMKSKL